MTDTLNATSPSDRADIAALRQLLSAQATLATAFEHVPTAMQGLTADFMAPISADADDVNAAGSAFGQLAPAAEPTLIASTTWAKMNRAIAGQERTDQIRAFGIKMENLLSRSANGRSQLASALSQTQDHCSIPPDQAAQQFNQVAENRQSLLDQASALTVPGSAAARNVLDLFQQALRHSIAADEAYRSWMNYLYNYYYEYPVGCPGNVPTDDNYDRAVGESQLATNVKTRLASAFNHLARQYGLRANWTAGEI